jgi:hypothetical protein
MTEEGEDWEGVPFDLALNLDHPLSVKALVMKDRNNGHLPLSAG